MNRYVRFDWPESQRFMDEAYDGADIVWADDMTVFVAEEEL